MPSSKKDQGISYDTKIIIVILFFLLAYPLGLILMWAWMRWPTKIKVLLTILPILFIIVLSIFLWFFINSSINPHKKYNEYVNNEVIPARESDVNKIATALSEYKKINKSLPNGITSEDIEISTGFLDICTFLVPEYMDTMPIDPTNPSGLPMINTQERFDKIGEFVFNTDCKQGPYFTHYYVRVESDGKIVVTSKPDLETEKVISASSY